MKTLQNDFTTPEQSKRLLELGVPADSADCYLLRTHTKGDTFIVEVLHDELYSGHDKFTDLLEYLPCWSVGRLIEIYHICDKPGFSFSFHVCFPNLISEMIYKIAEAKEHGWIDFSKLEE